MNRPTVLVLGATGRFGAAAAQAFAAAGWQVLAQQRRAPAAPLPRDVQVLQVPLDATDTLVRQSAGASVVVHAVNPEYTRWDRELLPLLRQGLAVAERLGARFMLPGNVYNYGAGMPALLDERTAQRPTTAKGALRAEMEAELERRAAAGLDSVVVRAGDFYGAGTGSWLDLVIVRSIARGRIVYPGPLDVPHAWAYLPDLAAAFVAVAGADSVRGCLKLHFEGHTLTGQAFVDTLERAADTLGLRPPAGFDVRRLPWGLMRLGGLFSPMLRELCRMSYLWRVPHALEGRALRRLAGTLPHTPAETALRQALIALGHAAAPGDAHPAPAGGH